MQSLDEDIQLPGDALLTDVQGQMTHAITIHAPPAQIWPWLVQMGGGRAGWYSLDALDNAKVRSDIRVRSDLQDLRVGDILPATPDDPSGFEVLTLEPPHTLVLGGLFVPGSDATSGSTAPAPNATGTSRGRSPCGRSRTTARGSSCASGLHTPPTFAATRAG